MFRTKRKSINHILLTARKTKYYFKKYILSTLAPQDLSDWPRNDKLCSWSHQHRKIRYVDLFQKAHHQWKIPLGGWNRAGNAQNPKRGQLKRAVYQIVVRISLILTATFLRTNPDDFMGIPDTKKNGEILDTELSYESGIFAFLRTPCGRKSWSA